MAEPPPIWQTFFTGQPMLTSTDATPSDSSTRAASAISPGTEPKSCTARGVSSARVSINFSALRFFSSSERALTRSVVHSPTLPTSRITRRKGRLV